MFHIDVAIFSIAHGGSNMSLDLCSWQDSQYQISKYNLYLIEVYRESVTGIQLLFLNLEWQRATVLFHKYNWETAQNIDNMATNWRPVWASLFKFTML